MSNSSRDLPRSLRHAARDVVLIVFSILIAFWLEGGREARQERDLLRQHLHALTSEFRHTQAQLRKELESVRHSADASARILEMMRQGARADPDSVPPVLLQSLSAGLFTADDPVLASMLSSGELIDLRNDALMESLARWRERMEHLRTDSRHLERNREETIRDRTVELGIPLGPFTGDEALVRPHAEAEVAVLLSDPGLRVAFTARYERAARLALSYRNAIEESEAIIRMLDAAGTEV